MSKYYVVEKLLTPNGDETHTSTRYVRADVAIRYARMREREGYELHESKHAIIHDCDNACCWHYATYEEAKQAEQREGK